eukprot:4553507-Pyramimonas_sp.AAC.1
MGRLEQLRQTTNTGTGRRKPPPPRPGQPRRVESPPSARIQSSSHRETVLTTQNGSAAREPPLATG